MFRAPADSLPANNPLSLPPPLPDNHYFNLYRHGPVIFIFQLPTYGITESSSSFITSFMQHYVCETLSDWQFILFHCCVAFSAITVSFSYCKYHHRSFSYWWTFGVCLFVFVFSSLGLLWVTLLEHSGTCLFVDVSTHPSWVYTQEWNCWVMCVPILRFSKCSQRFSQG